MIYKPAIKGLSIKKPVVQKTINVLNGVGEIMQLVSELNSLKSRFVSIIESKTKEIDNAISSIKDTVEEIKEIKQGNPGKDADEDKIIREISERIPPQIDTKKLSNDIISSIPKVETLNKKELLREVKKLIDEKKGDLKIIKETVETDPMAIIDKIMALPKQKERNKMIDGIQQTIRAMQSQLARGYLHGAGIPSLTEGSGITLTKTADGGYAVSAAGGTNVFTETPQGIIDGNNKVYTTVHNINNVITFAINGMYIHKAEYTVLNNTITFINALDSSLTGKEFDIVYS